MRCSLECHPGCECRPNQPIKALVQAEEPITLEGMMEYLATEDVMAEDNPESVEVYELLRRMKEARSGGQ